MEYKYRRGQIFGKRLKVPRYILSSVYRCTLSFEDFVKYELDDKIPITCLKESDRRIVEKFGMEKAKTLDWELLDKRGYYNHKDYSFIDFRELLMSIDASVENVNTSFYKLVTDQMRPSEYHYYSLKMEEFYQDRLFEISEKDDSNYELKDKKRDFNDGYTSLEELVRNWDLYKNKDVSYCLKNDKHNEWNISDSQLKDFMNQFMNQFKNTSRLILNHTNVYQFIHEMSDAESELEKKEYIKKVTDSILEKTIEEGYLSIDEYKELFEYSSMQDYLKKIHGWGHHGEDDIDKIFEELKTLPQDYIFNIPIPFTELLNSEVLGFIGTYGLKNVVDFDSECGHFFTKNNCQMLKLMYPMYLCYGNNVHDPNRTIFTKNSYDENGNYIDRPYTKDEFYEAMRRMIYYGPTNGDYKDKAPDYRDMTGEFRVRNAQLFVSEEAPAELQKLFYSKNITPQLLVEHPDYVPYLNGKDLGSCFKPRYVRVEGTNVLYNYENFYDFIGEKTDFNSVMSFLTEYSDIFDIIFDDSMFNGYQNGIKFSTNDDINQIQNRIHETLRNLIIEEGITYPTHIPKNLIEKYPSMFLDKNAPQELQEAFYRRTITSDFILSNPTYRSFLNGIDLEVLFEYTPVNMKLENPNEMLRCINFTDALRQTFGEKDALDVMLIYDKYVKQAREEIKSVAYKPENFLFLYDPEFTQDDFLNELDKSILRALIDGNVKYDENMPSHFKNNNPTLFLSQNVSQEIRNKFYNREFTLNDFETNPELLDIFGNTNVACGFSEKVSWTIPLFGKLDDLKMANNNRLKVISAFLKIQDDALKKIFIEYVTESGDDIDIEKIEYASEVLSRLSLSNSSEMFTFKKELANQILKTDSPIESLNKIEDMFIRNNIPIVGKIYSCFEILHPNFQGFDFSKDSMVSPTLKSSSTTSKQIIVFSDLIKACFGSNNQSVNAYLKNIEIGSNLYESIKSGQIQYDSLDESQKKELIIFSKHLATLYNNTMKGKKETFTTTENIVTDISELSKKLSPDGNLDYNLADRVIRMFCGFAGINTLEQAKSYINQKIKTADTRNRNASSSQMILEKGDFMKGIGDITYLRNILQNGSVSKEYLGSSAGSDATPLDTDVSIITSDGTIREKMSGTNASYYGPIWLILKNDDRFVTTRTEDETLETKRDMSKIEAFYTGVMGREHYGIRTGFASSEINYIVMDSYDPRVGLEIAMNGFYIPVANKEGKIVFTPNDYDRLREKMGGLSHYDENNYPFSENLVTEETEYLASQIEQSNEEVQVKRAKINAVIKKSLEELGLNLKTNIDGDLTEGFVELIDTGSTGRGTNKPGDGDFDFMMRLDKAILSNPSKIGELKQTLLRNLGKENSAEVTGTGDFRLKGIQLDSETNVDIDITFTEKTDKVSYSTDMALQDRLATIQRNNPEKYNYVVANILLAKQVLKQAEVYKPNRGEVPQGGLGGVGIENWILQNGGSFIDAAASFIEASNGKDFEEFKENYQIWDFGENHLAERRGQYSHDNFVANNMSKEGYQKMVQTLKEYMKNNTYNQTDMMSETDSIKR